MEPTALKTSTTQPALPAQDPAVSPQIQKKICISCAKEEPRSLCGRCKSIRYCDRTCQTRDWERHKKSCVMIINQKEELLPLVEKCFTTSFATNTAFYFKYKSDGVDIPHLNLPLYTTLKVSRLQ